MQQVIQQCQSLQHKSATSHDNSGCILTLKTCLQFFPLSFNRLSSISIISTKSFLLLTASMMLPNTDSPIDVLIVGELRQLVHLRSRWSPRVVGGGISQLGLHEPKKYPVSPTDRILHSPGQVGSTYLRVGVSFCIVLGHSESAFAAETGVTRTRSAGATSNDRVRDDGRSHVLQ